MSPTLALSFLMLLGPVLVAARHFFLLLVDVGMRLDIAVLTAVVVVGSLYGLLVWILTFLLKRWRKVCRRLANRFFVSLGGSPASAVELRLLATCQTKEEMQRGVATTSTLDMPGTSGIGPTSGSGSGDGNAAGSDRGKAGSDSDEAGSSSGGGDVRGDDGGEGGTTHRPAGCSSFFSTFQSSDGRQLFSHLRSAYLAARTSDRHSRSVSVEQPRSAGLIGVAAAVDAAATLAAATVAAGAMSTTDTDTCSHSSLASGTLPSSSGHSIVTSPQSSEPFPLCAPESGQAAAGRHDEQLQFSAAAAARNIAASRRPRSTAVSIEEFDDNEVAIPTAGRAQYGDGRRPMTAEAPLLLSVVVVDEHSNQQQQQEQQQQQQREHWRQLQQQQRRRRRSTEARPRPASESVAYASNRVMRRIHRRSHSHSHSHSRSQSRSRSRSPRSFPSSSSTQSQTSSAEERRSNVSLKEVEAMNECVAGTLASCYPDMVFETNEPTSRGSVSRLGMKRSATRSREWAAESFAEPRPGTSASRSVSMLSFATSTKRFREDLEGYLGVHDEILATVSEVDEEGGARGGGTGGDEAIQSGHAGPGTSGAGAGAAAAAAPRYPAARGLRRLDVEQTGHASVSRASVAYAGGATPAVEKPRLTRASSAFSFYQRPELGPRHGLGPAARSIGREDEGREEEGEEGEEEEEDDEKHQPV